VAQLPLEAVEPIEPVSDFRENLKSQVNNDLPIEEDEGHYDNTEVNEYGQ